MILILNGLLKLCQGLIQLNRENAPYVYQKKQKLCSKKTPKIAKISTKGLKSTENVFILRSVDLTNGRFFSHSKFKPTL